MRRAMFSGVPKEPKQGDLGPVMDAVGEIVDAAGSLEYSRVQLHRVLNVAQAEFAAAQMGFPSLSEVQSWGGRNTPAVYYEFYNSVAWTRAVEDRYVDRLRDAVKHDPVLWVNLQKIRSRAKVEFDDARVLAKCALHKYTPPYALAGARVVERGALIYPVPIIRNPEEFRENLRNIPPDRHVVTVVEGFWTAVSRFVDGLLDVFYPPA